MDRRLYDLCRKYRYFYNKHKDVELWDKKYHDIDLSDAVLKTATQLDCVVDEMLKELFRLYKFYPMNINIDREVPLVNEMSYFGHKLTHRHGHSISTIEVRDAERFIRALTEHMYDWRSYNEMW